MNKLETLRPLAEDTAEAQNQLRQDMVAQIVSFKRVRSRAKRWAGLIHGLAFVLFAVGVIAPILPSIFGVGTVNGTSLSPVSVGYLALALGGVVMLVDQVFGFSSIHRRMRIAEMRLVGALHEFDLRWAQFRAGTAESGNGQAIAQEALRILYDARLTFHAIITEQVESWISDRETSRAFLASKFANPDLAGQHNRRGQ